MEELEETRRRVKRSNDPQEQLDFSRKLIGIAEQLKRSQLDPAKIKQNRDILHAEAVRWIKKASSSTLLGRQGLPDALFMLADCYGNGTLGLQIDHDKAFSLYAQAAKQGHLASIYRCGVCYEVGAGTKRDHSRAIQHYRKAGMLGDTAAMFKIGMILLNGLLGHTKNPREGINWLKRAASQADETTPHALHELAILYQGNDPEVQKFMVPDPLYAQELLLKSAQLGYAPSQCQLGLAYEYGFLGLPVDPRRSIAWYSKAAAQGDPQAELALAGWYLSGCEGVLQRSETETYLWAKKAADKGLARAEFALGLILEHGIGTSHPDFEESRRCYMRAAGQGNKRAVQRLKEMNAGIFRKPPYRPQEWRADPDCRNGECSIM